MRFFTFGMHVEILEVAPAVGDEESILLRTPGLSLFWFLKHSRAASDHLPKLDIRVDRLGEDEIHDFTNVHTGIEHVHGDRHAGHVLVLELVEQPTLAVNPRILGNQHTRQTPFVLRVELIEQPLKAPSVVDRDGEEDRFARECPRWIFDAFLHELPDDQAVRTRVGDLAFEIRSLEINLFDVLAFGDQLALFGCIELLSVDPLQLKLGAYLEDLEIAQVRRLVANSFLERVRKGGVLWLALEKLESIVVDVVRRGRRQADLDCAEIVEHRLIDVVDAAVALVRNHDIEEEGRDVGFRRRSLFNEVQHPGVGRDVDSPASWEFVIAGFRPSRLRCKVLLECIESLVPKSNPVNKEKHALRPAGPHEHINEADGCSGLPSARCHRHEELALFGFQSVEDCPDRVDLVVSPSNAWVNQLDGERTALLAA